MMTTIIGIICIAAIVWYAMEKIVTPIMYYISIMKLREEGRFEEAETLKKEVEELY